MVKLLYLCLGTVKSARTSFLLLDLVFMFMQKSMAACRGQDRGHNSGQDRGWDRGQGKSPNRGQDGGWSRGQAKNEDREQDGVMKEVTKGVKTGVVHHPVYVRGLTLSMRSRLTQLGSCWMKASTMSFMWEPVLASSSSCSTHSHNTNKEKLQE